MLSDVLLIAGVAVLAAGLRSFSHPALRKLGVLAILAVSYLVGNWLTGRPAVGVACGAAWLFLPWLEILTRIRRLRLPAERTLCRRMPPPASQFPALAELTDEIEEGGYVHVEDAGIEWDECRQYFRLFYRAADRSQAAICMVDQQEVAFFFLSISSRDRDGLTWTTWNYPFSYSLVPPPGCRLNRVRPERSFLDLHRSHGFFLARHGVGAERLTEIDPEQLQTMIRDDLKRQLDHNVARGILRLTADGKLRYSWRGFLFLWRQFLIDLIRIP